MDGQITQVAITLSGILLLIVTLGFVAKRANKSGLLGAGAMRVVASLNLGVKEKLVLIEVGEEQLIIAVGAAGISKLHTLAAPLQ
ncbi:MAG: flagellar protein FliO/FliZ, partial [Candidatus Azotimanducaceae bacterium]